MNLQEAIRTQPSPHVLSSWKEIATFLGKGVRTVQRWEICFGLPIHRPGGSHGSVLAYPTELDEWWHKLWKDHKFTTNARLEAETRSAESPDMLGMVLELANSCAALNRKNGELLNHQDKPTNIEPGKSRRSRRSVRKRRPPAE